MIKNRKSIKTNKNIVPKKTGPTNQPTSIHSDLQKNISLFKTLYSYPTNADFKVRDIFIPSLQKQAALVYIDTITDTVLLERGIIHSLSTQNKEDATVQDLLTTQSISTEMNVEKITTGINNGSVALFIEESDHGYILQIPKFEGRQVDKAENETTVKGPQEAFNEIAATNISLIRKRIKNEHLIAESITVSKRAENKVSIVYVNNLVNEQLLEDVRSRISSIDTDAIHTLSQLEQYIEDRSLTLFPTMLYTERPDRAAMLLEDGHIVLVMDNSPDCLILPATFWTFFHSPEDSYLRFTSGNFTRLIRILALFITLFFSAIYIAITNFHVEMIPPDLLLAIASTRDKVPLPAFLELILMEVAFELIREAGLRAPTPIAPMASIVGALIIGQSAVQANIISPIVVIIVALSGLCSFIIGDISMNIAIRITRFLCIFAAGLFGLFGLTAIVVAEIAYIVSLKSFGTPYFAPLTPKILPTGTYFRTFLQKDIFRPGYLKTKDITKR